MSMLPVTALYAGPLPSVNAPRQLVPIGVPGPTGPQGPDGPSLISDATAIDPAITDASATADFLIASYGGDARKVLLTAVSRLLLAATDAAAARTAIGAGTGNGNALTSSPLSQFASTTSAQLAGVLSDKTGFSTGALTVYSISPTFTGVVTVSGAATSVVSSTSTNQVAYTDFTAQSATGRVYVAAGTTTNVPRIGFGLGSTQAGASTTVGFLGASAGGPTFINFSTNGGSTSLHVTHNHGAALLTFTSAGVETIRSNGLRGWVSSSTDSIGSADTASARAAAAVQEFNNGTAAAAGTFRSVPISPTQIAADTNNYAPTAGGMFYRLSTDASRTITGMSISQVNGQVFEIWNVGSFNIVLAHDSASSTAANRFLCTGAANITLAPNEIALVRYDSTTSRYRARKV